MKQVNTAVEKTKKNKNKKIKQIKTPAQLQEQKEIKEIAQLTGCLLDTRYTAVGEKKLRGVHPKSHGCVKATFTINADLAKPLQKGLFSSPGKSYQAMIRFSNATALVEDDMPNGQNSSRGMAVKVFDVTENGRLLKSAQHQADQDFLMINNPAFAFANVPDYLRLTQVISENNDSADKFFTPLADPTGFTEAEVARTMKSFSVVQQILATPVEDPLQVRYFGAAPFRFGKNQVMRFAVVPSGGATAQSTPENPAPNYLKDVLNERMKTAEPVAFDFMVQIRNADEEGLDLEDATTFWDESEHAFIKVATINIPTPQLNLDSEAHEAACESLVFTPWHSLAAHKPLGGINRLRRKVYKTSSQSRLEGQDISQCPFHAAKK